MYLGYLEYVGLCVTRTRREKQGKLKAGRGGVKGGEGNGEY